MVPFATANDSSHLHAAAQLSEDQQERLAVLLERFLKELEDGLPPTAEELAKDDPDLLETLESYLVGLQDLHSMAAELHSSAQPRSRVVDQPESGSSSEHMLGDFRLQDVIGRGGMGVVYRAHQISLDREVAVKLLPLTAVLDPRQIERFRNEAQAAAQLNDPHIVPVYAVGCERGVHFYAMQLIDGASLDQVIANAQSQNGYSDWRESVRLAIQAANALQAAHEFGIVHRDIKPSNLLVDPSNHLWVTDFGLARCHATSSLTQSGDVIGTMKYMSPEQARGESALVDGRTDVYSLGATLYEMLCLAPAVDAEDAPSLLRQIDERKVAPLRQRRHDLPRDLETVVAKAMCKARDGRYETAADFAEDLRRVLAGEATVARPPTIVDRMLQWSAAHRRGVAAVVLTCLVALVGLSISIALVAAEKRKSDMSGLKAKTSARLARGAVDRLVQGAELLRDVPTASPVRQLMLNEALDYYVQFAAQSSDDPTARVDLAIAHGKIGSLHRELGAVDEAIASLEKSHQLFSELASNSPGYLDISRQLATSQNNLAEVLQQIGRIEEAAKLYASAIKTQEALLEQNNSVARDLGVSLNNFGLLLSQTGDREQAERHYRRAVEIFVAASDSDPSPQLSEQTASVYHNLCELLALSKPTSAIEFARSSLAIQTDKLASEPSNVKLANRVSFALNSLANAQLNAQAYADAETSLTQAIAIGRQVQQRQTNDLTYCRHLATSYNLLGLVRCRVGKLQEARQAFEESASHQQFLTQNFSNDAEIQSTMGGILNNLGFLQQRSGQGSSAIDSFELAIHYQSRAMELAPLVVKYQKQMEKHRENLASCMAEIGAPVLKPAHGGPHRVGLHQASLHAEPQQAEPAPVASLHIGTQITTQREEL